jgi:large subunit ribosomal protein L4
VKLLGGLSLGEKKTLLVLPQNDDNVLLSSRNLKRAKVTTADRINTYDVINADNVVFLESSIEKVEQILTK